MRRKSAGDASACRGKTHALDGMGAVLTNLDSLQRTGSKIDPVTAALYFPAIN